MTDGNKFEVEIFGYIYSLWFDPDEKITHHSCRGKKCGEYRWTKVQTNHLKDLGDPWLAEKLISALEDYIEKKMCKYCMAAKGEGIASSNGCLVCIECYESEHGSIYR